MSADHTRLRILALCALLASPVIAAPSAFAEPDSLEGDTAFTIGFHGEVVTAGAAQLGGGGVALGVSRRVGPVHAAIGYMGAIVWAIGDPPGDLPGAHPFHRLGSALALPAASFRFSDAAFEIACWFEAGAGLQRGPAAAGARTRPDVMVGFSAEFRAPAAIRRLRSRIFGWTIGAQFWLAEPVDAVVAAAAAPAGGRTGPPFEASFAVTMGARFGR